MKNRIRQSREKLFIIVGLATWIVISVLLTFMFGLEGLWLSLLSLIGIYMVSSLIAVFFVVLWECFHKDPKPTLPATHHKTGKK